PMRLRKRCASIAAFLAQMRGLFQRRFWYSPLRHEGKTGRPAPAHRAGAIHLRLEFSESGLLLVPALGPRARGDRFRRRGKRAPSPGVLAVLTGRDVAEAGYKSIPTNLGVKDRFGEPLKKPPRPVLAQGKVRHVGECVACVVAE